MAEVKPFRGVRYNESLVQEMSAVICPPYDVITPQLQEELYNRSTYNFIRLEHGRKLPQDSTVDNKYTRSASIIEEWLRKKVLITEEKPCIYLHDHHFLHMGRQYKRRCLIARIKLEDWHKNVIRPHEGTLVEPKNDRISLLWALGANTSPILAMFEDDKRYVSSLIDTQELGKPIVNIESYDTEAHRLWKISGDSIIKKLSGFFADKSLYIADGHHRYESSLIYQREQRAINAGAPEDAVFNYTLMSLVDFDDPGLLILPPHRLIRGMAPSKLEGLGEKLIAFFDIEELPLNLPDIWDRIDRLLADERDIRLFLFGLNDESLFLLTLRDFAAAEKMMPYFHSPLYKRLDVSIVDHVILEELLGLSSEDEVKISYNYDHRDTVKQVQKREHQLAFIISPINSRKIKDISDAGDRMPRKSTYFYPKMPSGLVLNRLV
ncbi:MAG TPA: DUF1015 domain-containing protein [Dehalococcoidia bacterium]|nr:DUF1015 domain-containing protein [Dehalococcoidia bacterium]